MSATYAGDTKVSVAASETEIRGLLARFGAANAMIGTYNGEAVVAFERNGRAYKMTVALPDELSDEFRWRGCGRGYSERTPAQRRVAWEQACRVKYRALALLIKAKLVAIGDETAAFEDEFLAYAVLPDRRTVGQWAEEQMRDFQIAGQLPALMPGRE